MEVGLDICLREFVDRKGKSRMQVRGVGYIRYGRRTRQR